MSLGSRIRDRGPGVQKAPDPGSGSATLQKGGHKRVTSRFTLLFCLIMVSFCWDFYEFFDLWVGSSGGRGGGGERPPVSVPGGEGEGGEESCHLSCLSAGGGGGGNNYAFLGELAKRKRRKKN